MCWCPILLWWGAGVRASHHASRKVFGVPALHRSCSVLAYNLLDASHTSNLFLLVSGSSESCGIFFVAPISSRGLQVTFVPLCSNLCAQRPSMLSCGCDEQVGDGGGRPLAGGCAKAGS